MFATVSYAKTSQMRLTFHIAASVAAGCACLSACKPSPMVSRSSELRVVAGPRLSGAAPSALYAEVRGRAPEAGSIVRRGLEARITLELKGDAIEYRVRLVNPGAVVVTEAWVTLQGEDGREGSPVVQLFSGGRFRDPYLELRGTGSVLASMRTAVIVAELQTRPQAFAVTLRGLGLGNVWSGRLFAETRE